MRSSSAAYLEIPAEINQNDQLRGQIIFVFRWPHRLSNYNSAVEEKSRHRLLEVAVDNEAKPACYSLGHFGIASTDARFCRDPYYGHLALSLRGIADKALLPFRSFYGYVSGPFSWTNFLFFGKNVAANIWS